jgi:hypothetical protein
VRSRTATERRIHRCAPGGGGGGGIARQTDVPKLAVQIVKDSTAVKSDWRGEVHVGAHIRARALPAGEAHFEILVYRGARDLLLRCPQAGPTACLEPDRSMLVWTIPSVVQTLHVR